MGEVINLRLRRKDTKREEKEKSASENRVKFGEGKGAKTLRKRESEKAEKHLSGVKRDLPETDA